MHLLPNTIDSNNPDQKQMFDLWSEGFGDLDLKKGVDHDLKLEKGEVWNKI